MNFKSVNKHYVGMVATVILVMLLSQHRFLNFLINTALGRAVLILFILGISYTNHILGIVAVLFIIIMVNQNELSFMVMEGFTDVSKNNTLNNNKKDTLKVKETVVKAVPAKNTSTTSSKTIGGREGFNMIEREGSMLRGKRSNEVPVFANARNQNDDVEPTDKSVFGADYAVV